MTFPGMRRVLRATALLTLLGAPLHAQQPDGELGTGPLAHMHTILERTFLKFDVLALDVCVDVPTATRLHELGGADAPADSIAAVVIRTPEARARVRMLRNVSLNQFIDGVMSEQRKAVEAGMLDDSVHQAVRASLPEWFSFLRERGLREDDEIVYDFEADTLRTTYVSAEGNVLLRNSVTGWPRRTSVLATYFSPDSDFREGLIESLSRQVSEEARRACRPLPASS